MLVMYINECELSDCSDFVVIYFLYVGKVPRKLEPASKQFHPSSSHTFMGVNIGEDSWELKVSNIFNIWW